MKFETFSRFTEWLIIAEQWPYRSSLLAQLLDDYNVRKCPEEEGKRPLIDIYKENEELLSKPKNWENLCSIDDNPETFELFLKETDLTFELLKTFMKYTINMDFSLKETFSLAFEQDKIKKKEKPVEIERDKIKKEEKPVEIEHDTMKKEEKPVEIEHNTMKKEEITTEL